MDVDLRKLRYFMAVAGHCNFSRAAEELHIAQPVLSRQIRALESELGATLFVRDKKGTRLTSAGAQLAADAEPILADAEALRRRVARAARGPGTFTVAFMPGLIITEPIRVFGGAHPELTVEVLRTGWDNQTAVLHDGRADVSLVRLPVDRQGLQLQSLFCEPRIAVLPADHRLAGKETVNIGDLADEHLLQHPDAVPEWRDVATELQGRRRIPPSRVTHSVEEKLEHVASGRGVVILPESTANYYQRPDIVHAFVHDLSPAEICLAWSSARRSPLIAEFANIATAGTIGPSWRALDSRPAMPGLQATG
jgi:DNA-binding transcriptional LysR family regulator